MAFAVTIHHPGLAGREYLVDKRTFIPFAVDEENLGGDSAVEIEPQVGLGLFGAVAIVGQTMESTASIKEPSMATNSPQSAGSGGRSRKALT